MSTPPGPTYPELLRIVGAELGAVVDVFATLRETEWALPTRLVPPDPDLPAWTLLELAGHLDISIGITSMLAADPRPGSAERDAVDFFAFPVEAPREFYDYAYTMVDGRSEGEMLVALRATFASAVAAASALPAGTVGEFPGFEPYPLIRMDDWISTRVLEAVVHGMDLTESLGRPMVATQAGLAHTAGLFDELMRLRGSNARPDDLTDDLRWVRAASGRDRHPDPRLPLIM